MKNLSKLITEYIHHGWRKFWIPVVWNAPRWRIWVSSLQNIFTMVEENFEFQLLEMLQNERFWQNDTKILKVYCKFSDLLGKTLFSLTIPDFPERVLRSSWDCLRVTLRSIYLYLCGCVWVSVFDSVYVWEFVSDFMSLVSVYVFLYLSLDVCVFCWLISCSLNNCPWTREQQEKDLCQK